MTDKLSRIGRWVLIVLAALTIGFTVWFYLDPATRTGGFLDWGYVVIFLGILIAIASPILGALKRKPNYKKIGIALGAIIIIGVIAYLMAKGSFIPYESGDISFSATTMGMVEFGIDFFYITLGVSLATIIFSVIYKSVK